jgi:hypothetical protein
MKIDGVMVKPSERDEAAELGDEHHNRKGSQV